jgi:hypothetical protein
MGRSLRKRCRTGNPSNRRPGKCEPGRINAGGARLTFVFDKMHAVHSRTKKMRNGIHHNHGLLQQFKNWESLSRIAGCSTPHSAGASSRRFPVLLSSRCAGLRLRRSSIDMTGMDPGQVITSPGNGAQWGAGTPAAIHAGSSKARPRRNSDASPGAVVGGAGTFDGMFDCVVLQEPTSG